MDDVADSSMQRKKVVLIWAQRDGHEMEEEEEEMCSATTVRKPLLPI